MAEKKKKSDTKLLILFTILAVGSILFLVSTDIITLFTTASLTLDHTGTRATPDERGADGITGQFTAEANLADFIERFQGRLDDYLNQLANNRLQVVPPTVENPPMCSMGACSKKPPVGDLPVPEDIPPFIDEPPITIIPIDGDDPTIIDLSGGGGISSSTLATGVQQLIRNNVVVHERFHTPANAQSTTGSILIKWGHGLPITVQQFLVPDEYFDWFEFEIPQTLRGDGFATFDGVSENEFFYKLTIPEDLINRDTVIPIRMIINTQDSVVDAVTEIQIERQVESSEQFSVAEFIRSIFTEVRQFFA
jgi:hypothetical protein